MQLGNGLLDECRKRSRVKRRVKYRKLKIFWSNVQKFWCPNMVGYWSLGQTIATWQGNISQHCWAQHVVCVWPHVGCCWLKFENAQIWTNNTQHVKTCCNSVAKRTKHVAPNKVAIRCVGMLKAPAKRSQHANATHPNIVERNMLCAFGHRVAMCCDMLAVVSSVLTILWSFGRGLTPFSALGGWIRSLVKSFSNK